MKARVRNQHRVYWNKSKPGSAGKMSKEVSRAIISKAQLQTPGYQWEEIHSLETIKPRNEQRPCGAKLSGFTNWPYSIWMIRSWKEDLSILCDRIRVHRQTGRLRAPRKDPIILTKRIGAFLKGRSMDVWLNVSHPDWIDHDIKKYNNEKSWYIIVFISKQLILSNSICAAKDRRSDFPMQPTGIFEEGDRRN